MKISRTLLGVALVAASAVSVVAQQAPSGYHRVACYKVKPEKVADYRKWVQQDVHKLQQSLIDSGTLSTWYLLRAVIPTGESAQCDYLSVIMFPGAPPAPMGLTELGAALKKAGMTTTAQDYVDRRNSLTELVSNNLFQNQVFVGSVKKGDYFMVNYMKVPNTTDWLAYEKKTWQPLAESMAKDGIKSGWSVNLQVLPSGSDLKFNAVTVDVYPSWDSIYKNFDFAGHFKKAHPDLEIGTTMEEFAKLRTILSTDLYVLDDVATSAK